MFKSALKEGKETKERLKQGEKENIRLTQEYFRAKEELSQAVNGASGLEKRKSDLGIEKSILVDELKRVRMQLDHLNAESQAELDQKQAEIDKIRKEVKLIKAEESSKIGILTKKIEEQANRIDSLEKTLLKVDSLI